MRKKVGIIKRISCIGLIFLLSINSFAAVVSDNDGSAFITKAEFDALKSSFQSQIDTYNKSIDSKIDGAIASYLSGIKLSSALNTFIDENEELTFVNYMRNDEYNKDNGLLSLSANRLSYGLGLSRLEAKEMKGYKPSSNYIKITWNTPTYGSDKLRSFDNAITEASWDNSTIPKSAKNVSFIGFESTDKECLTQDLSGSKLKSALVSVIADVVGEDMSVTLYCSSWLTMLRIGFRDKIVMKKKMFRWTPLNSDYFDDFEGKANVSETAVVKSGLSAFNIFSKNELDNFGIGWMVETKNNTRMLKSFGDKITIMNTINTQQYTYKDHSADSYNTNPDAWNDTTQHNVSIIPSDNWNLQEYGTMHPVSYQGISDDTYSSFQATQLKISDNSAWSNNHQLGINTYVPFIKTFDDACPMDHSSNQIITNSDTQFNRTGYYLDNSGNLVTKLDNIVKSGDITYQKLQWKSEDLAPNQIALEALSNFADETVVLCGGIPLAESPSENLGKKVKLDYEVQKLDGSALTAADGDMNIKIELSNKQFLNGTVASGATSYGSYTATVNSTASSGHWDSPAFDMDAKDKVWLNAYVSDKQGYNVIIKNIVVK